MIREVKFSLLVVMIVDELIEQLQKDPYYIPSLTTLGHGWQYSVYQLEATRVLKIPRFYPAYSCKKFVEEHQQWLGTESPNNQLEIKADTERSNAAVRNSGIPAEYLGNPEFHPREIIVQDWLAVPGLDAEWSGADARAFFEQYARLIQLGWKFGLGDTTHNFFINTGFDREGRLVFADFSELEPSRTIVEQLVVEKQWLRAHNYMQLEPTLQKLYARIMEEELSIEKLDQLWSAGLTRKT